MLRRSLIIFLLVSNNAAFAGDSTQTTNKSHSIISSATLEYAGGFGLLSAAASIDPGMHTSLSLNVGYTPPAFGNIWTTNILFSYDLMRIRLNKNFSLHPFKAGAFVNLNYGKHIYFSRPDQYSPGYYWWNSAIRFGPFIDSEIIFRPEKGFGYSVFFQTLTNDLYIYSYLPNGKRLTIFDLLIFGIGGRILFAK